MDLNRRLRLAWPRASLRTYLIVMVLAATVPLAGLLAYRLVHDIREQRALLQDGLQAMTRAIAVTVERELMASADTLSILANTQALRSADLPAFRALLASADLRPSAWSGVFLLGADGSVLIDTRTPPDASKEAPGRATVEAPDGATIVRELGAGRVHLSNLLDATDPARRATAIAVPTATRGGTRYVLGAFIGLDTWQRLIQASGAPAGGVVRLFDAQHRILAATPGSQPRVGSILAGASIDAVSAQASGACRLALFEGTQAHAAWQRIEPGGWGVAAGVPVQAIDAAQRRASMLTLAAVAACLLLGGGAASLVARRVTEPIARLAEHGAAAPATAPIEVIEIAQLHDALGAAAQEEHDALRRLAETAQEFETLFRSSPLALAFAQDRNARTVLRNVAMQQLLPAQADELVVLHDAAPLAPQHQPLQCAALHGVTTHAKELEIRRPGEAPRFVLASAVPLLDAQGSPRGAIGAFADITNRKLAESRLHASERELRRSQNLVELAQRVGNVGFFEYQWESRRLLWSPGHAQLFGAEPPSAGQALALWEERVDAAEREHFNLRLGELIAAGARSGVVEFRVIVGTAPRWLQSRLAIEYDASGRASRLVGVTIDVTEQKTAEHERALLMEREQAARVEAETANRAKDDFLALLGHELRNPLNAIATAAEILHRIEMVAPEAISARNIISRQTRRLARMLDNLLDVGRVIADEVQLVRHPINLASAVRRGVAAAQPNAAARNQSLSVALADAWIDADAHRISQVIDNLLDNAVKHSPAHGKIEVALRREPDAAVLCVGDSGAGIPPELLARMFEPFAQGARNLDRKAGGLGLGLTLVRRLVELHGGSVQARSSLDGNIFEVRLPAIEAPGAATGIAASGPADAPAPKPARLRVAVIDDNPDALDGLRVMLELDGHTVQTSADGETGLARLLREAPEVAIVDIGLPALDGYEVARRSRAGGYSGRLIALSGYGRASDQQRSIAAGFEAHLVKPVDPQRLQRLLATG